MSQDDAGGEPAVSGDESQAERKAPRNLAEWVEVLSDKGMPAFARSVQEISGVAADRASSAAELARVVLQDAAMTARLLRVANSPIYSPTVRGISTVSRAVVLLGFDTVRSLCLSIAVIDSLQGGAQKARMAEQMARSFHAAMQARSFAEKRGDVSPEEVFIATLLCGIGDLAFWSLKTGAARKLNEALQVPGVDHVRAEKQVLGFELNELSLALSRKWHLGELLENSLEKKGAKNPRVSNVEYARELAVKAEKGWESPEVKKLLGRVAEALYLPMREVTDIVHQNASQASRAARYFGVGDTAARLIPLPATATRGEAGEEPGGEEQQPVFLDPDPMLQLTILRELSGMMGGQHDINLLLEMVLEGVFRGVGMDRSLFAMLNPERTLLRARYALGWDKNDMRENFVFDVASRQSNIFSHVLASREPLWVGGKADPQLTALISKPVLALTGGAQFFVMPVEVNAKPIGLFYADRKPSGRGLDEDSFTAFKHFCQQANLALAYSRHGR
jgi:HD-like signal output (HDOD) protein